jgi:hypothetical protein
MSKNYHKVKDYYERGLWSSERVYNAVGRWITAEEYEMITKEVYHEAEVSETH